MDRIARAQRIRAGDDMTLATPLALIGALAVASHAWAADYRVVDVCATYLPTGAGYRMQAQVMDGRELNARVGGFRFSSFSTYVLLWWAQGEVTTIKLDLPFGPSAFGSEGADQDGRRWEVSTSTLFCR